MDDLPAFYARRLRALYHVSDVPSEEELADVCRARGVDLIRSSRLTQAGYHLYWPEPIILVRDDTGPAVALHELFHFWVADNAAHGIEPPPGMDEERAADRFALLVCRRG